MRKNKIVLRIALAFGVLCGGTVAYASIFGEENITLVQQLSELIGISNNTYKTLAEARDAVDLAVEARDTALQAEALVEELSNYTADRFVTDFKNDVLKTYPDLDYIISKTGSGGLTDWKSSNMRTPMGSYELIGRVFGEVTDEVKAAQAAGAVKTERATLYRYEAAASLTAAENATQFLKSSDVDLETLVERLNGATKEEAIVINAKIQAIVAAQNSHLIRLQARSIRRDGVDDARRYRSSIKALDATTRFAEGERGLASKFEELPVLLDLGNLE